MIWLASLIMMAAGYFLMWFADSWERAISRPQIGALFLAGTALLIVGFVVFFLMGLAEAAIATFELVDRWV